MVTKKNPLPNDTDETVENRPKKMSYQHWMRDYWRPVAAYMYMLICFMDFVGFPLLSMFLPSILHTGAYIPWKTLTLESGGMVHLAFGAIVGVSAWTRGNEKIAEINKQ